MKSQIIIIIYPAYESTFSSASNPSTSKSGSFSYSNAVETSLAFFITNHGNSLASAAISNFENANLPDF